MRIFFQLRFDSNNIDEKKEEKKPLNFYALFNMTSSTEFLEIDSKVLIHSRFSICTGLAGPLVVTPPWDPKAHTAVS